MATRDDNGDVEMAWPDRNEAAFLTILYERVKKDPSGTPSFKRSDWLEMDNELSLISGERYGVHRLQGKYNRLRQRYRQFSELLSYAEVTYDLATNTVFAPEDVWEVFYQKSKNFKAFKKKGCKNYELLGQVFIKSTPIAHFPQPLNQLPPTSNEERENEFEFLNQDQDAHVNEPEQSSSGKTCNGKRSADEMMAEFSHARTRPMSEKLDKIERCLELLASSLNAKNAIYFDKMKETEQESTTTTTTTMSACTIDPCSIEKCMKISTSFPNISHKAIVAAGKEFMNPDWRKVFMSMPTETQLWWVKSLE